MSTSGETVERVETREVPVPAALPAMGRLFRLGLRHEPRLLMASVLMSFLSALPDALLALWLKWLADGLVGQDRRLVLAGMVGLAISTSLSWVLQTVSTRVQRRFRDRVTIGLERHVAGLQAGIGTITHQERADYLDRLAILRDQMFVLDHTYMAVLSSFAWIVRVGVTLVLLGSVHPALVLLVLGAIPMVLVSVHRPVAERRTQEAAASSRRLAEHLYRVATTAGAAKELRVTGIGPEVVRRRRRERDAYDRPVARAWYTTAGWSAVAWLVFGLGFVVALAWIAGRGASAGDVLLLVTAGQRLSMFVAMSIGEIAFIRGTWMEGSRRLAWLEDYATAEAAAGTREAPDRLTRGIELRDVTFTYPGSDQAVLADVDLMLPAGSVIAIVGENGAGKSTLVKLLAGFYHPQAGQVLVDDVPLHALRPASWRERQAGAFQDFARWEFPLRDSVGLGDVAGGRTRVGAALSQAGAADLVAQLPDGLDTQLGPTWPDGVDVSVGQWQKIALARGFMRPRPLLLMLDEPTAALDAETEHALFAGYAEAARSAELREVGGITVLVSHRFSTVRMADLIVVLNGNRVAEVGTHDELMGRDGTYAELYRIQADAYSS